MLTKKHFKAVAKVISELDPDVQLCISRHLADELAEALGFKKNLNFDIEKYHYACNRTCYKCGKGRFIHVGMGVQVSDCCYWNDYTEEYEPVGSKWRAVVKDC